MTYLKVAVYYCLVIRLLLHGPWGVWLTSNTPFGNWNLERGIHPPAWLWGKDVFEPFLAPVGPIGVHPFNPPWGQLNQRNQEARPPKLMFLFGYVPSSLAQNQRRDIHWYSSMVNPDLARSPFQIQVLPWLQNSWSLLSEPANSVLLKHGVGMMSAQAQRDQTRTYQKMDQTWSNQKDQKVIVSNR